VWFLATGENGLAFDEMGGSTEDRRIDVKYSVD
jgi:hypothetical protein